MDQNLLDRLEEWHQAEEFPRIIDAIEAIPVQERGYELTGLLARAYENEGEADETEPYERAIALLESIRAEGADDPNWHFRMGYALYWLNREEEAISYFRKVLSLIPDDPESQAFWADCRELLIACHNEMEKKEIVSRYEADPLDAYNALDFLLRVSLHGGLETEDSVEGDHLWCPAWQMILTPEIEQLTEQSAVLHFHLSAPQWGQELFECSVGMGGEPKQALGMAVGSFLFSLMRGIASMENGEDPYIRLETSFAGRPHRWRVYFSHIVGMGNSPEVDGPHIYWDALQQELVKRLGNQKLCYVKVYAAKSYGSVTGECRINDIKSEELSALVAEMAEKWDVDGFASHKMFFFIRQEEETIVPYPYWGNKGRAALKSKVKRAAELFHACENQEQYEALPGRLEQELGDATLAAECYSFLPEICAENAFDQITYPETAEIQVGNGPSVTIWKNQLADYWPLHAALFELFEEGAFGDSANQIYQEYIGVSATYSVIQKMMDREKDSKLEDVKMITVRYQEDACFEIR